MIWFVLTFMCLYGAMHALVYWGIKPLLSGKRYLPMTSRVWMGIMVVAPVAVRLLDRHGYPEVARYLAWISYSWMGLAFLAFSMLLPLLCWDLFAFTLHSFKPTLPRLTVHSPTCALIVVVCTLGMGMYGFYEAAYMRVERIILLSDKLPPGTPPIRLAQVSDLHLGLIHREKALAPVITILQRLHPDLLVVTGDMVDAQIDHLNGLSDMWRSIDPPLGKFAVTGNHEVYAGLQTSLAFLQRSGFTLLRNKAVPIGDLLLLSGVDDPAAGHRRDAYLPLIGQEAKRFKILLKHRPVVTPEHIGLFDLQLSGHAHRGQIFPFNLLTHLAYPMQNGLYQLPSGGVLYASRGTGSWGPPMRIGAPPEITVFELIPSERETVSETTIPPVLQP
jgi:predicted MPP superfamily phosphohydrolase